MIQSTRSLPKNNKENTSCHTLESVELLYDKQFYLIESSRGDFQDFLKDNIIFSPAKTLGIFDMKLLTVRMGTPDFSSCIRWMSLSIWKNTQLKARYKILPKQYYPK